MPRLCPLLRCPLCNTKGTFFFFLSTWVWTQGLHHEPLHQLFCEWWGFFEIGSCKLFAWAGFEPWSSWVAEITGVSYRYPAKGTFRVSNTLPGGKGQPRIYLHLYLDYRIRSHLADFHLFRVIFPRAAGIRFARIKSIHSLVSIFITYGTSNLSIWYFIS
jgi:hypothetical protein